MLGLMQDWPLLCHRIIDHAATNHADRAVVSRSVEGPIHTTNYADIRARALKVAQRLDRDGIRLGDRVATLAWNTWRHLESLVRHHRHRRDLPHRQSAAVPRPDRLDRQSRRGPRDDHRPHLRAAPGEASPTGCRPIERYVVLTDAAHMPATSLKNAVPYEEWIGEVDGDFAWKSFDENTAAGMCYTSGTTGNPKGVLYSHRSNVLHSMMATQPDAMGVSSRDVVLPVVPMFHANCWGARASPRR